ncbi:MAG: hypothetical protein AVDCRST_MAG59-1595 [uncultured Thermomicrobiales bacterium]|uniref:FHA domain-containing protein n=1 Tax=uncultured Thermomicrobiales bacterium TaxID=1645740 RepID=A0A6J4UFA2_9BACT|nr:MAG: hypothetical protein AVDCRST_MAG59-1595 [uncultured Thermomicrobiales bacterium]
MSVLDRFEAACERLVEGSVGRLFRSTVQPAEIGRKLEKTMAANLVVSVDATLVPNDLTVALNPADFAPFAGYAPALGRQLETWLGEVAAKRSWTMVDRVRVRIEPVESVRRREIRVSAVIATVPPPTDDGSPPAPRAMDPMPPRGRPDGLRLRVLTGPQRGQDVLVRPPAATVGRAPDNDIVLVADDISRHHARLELGRGGAKVVDLRSRNGTTLNGQPVTGAAFGPGDELGFGSVAVAVLAVNGERPGR